VAHVCVLYLLNPVLIGFRRVDQWINGVDNILSSICMYIYIYTYIYIQSGTKANLHMCTQSGTKCNLHSTVGASWNTSGDILSEKCQCSNAQISSKTNLEGGLWQEISSNATLTRDKQQCCTASISWCILRVHCDKRVLHLLPVDAGATRPKKHKTQQFVRNAQRHQIMVHPEGALCKMGATLTSCWRRSGQTRNIQKHSNLSEVPRGQHAHQKHGASWGCTWKKGCYTYVLLTQARPDKKNKKHSNLSEVPLHQSHGASWGCTV
jgi:hypothetical protein